MEHDVKLYSHWDDAVGLSCSCGHLVWVYVGRLSSGEVSDLTLSEVLAWQADHTQMPANMTSWRSSDDAEWGT